MFVCIHVSLWWTRIYPSHSDCWAPVTLMTPMKGIIKLKWMHGYKLSFTQSHHKGAAELNKCPDFSQKGMRRILDSDWLKARSASDDWLFSVYRIRPPVCFRVFFWGLLFNLNCGSGSICRKLNIYLKPARS